MKTRKTIKSSIVVIFNQNEELLLLRRTMLNREHLGKYTHAGGKLKKGETFLMGAIRETFEETGLEFKPSDLKFLFMLSTTGKHKDYLTSVYIIKQPIASNQQINISNEHDFYSFIVPHNALHDKNISKKTREIIHRIFMSDNATEKGNEYHDRVNRSNAELGLLVNWNELKTTEDAPKVRGTYLVIPRANNGEYNPVDGTFYIFNAEYRREQMVEKFSHWAEFPIVNNPN